MTLTRTPLKPGRHDLTPSQQAGYDEVHARAAQVTLAELCKARNANEDIGGRDEILGGRGGEFSHRRDASDSHDSDGGYQPWNGVWLSRGTHEVLTRDFPLARAGGWRLNSWEDPSRVPVWLALPMKGWWWIRPAPDGGPHLLAYCDNQPPRPRLPFERRTDYEAFLSSVRVTHA